MNTQNKLINNKKALKLIRSVKLPVVIAGQLLQISFEKEQTKEEVFLKITRMTKGNVIK